MKYYYLIILFGLSLRLSAFTGDTIHVKTHDSVFIKTDPSVGHTNYPKWGHFPTVNTKYNRVILQMSYGCPPGKHCGEWDYINSIYIRRAGSVNAASQDLEIVRFITPYGYNFPSNWKYTWYADVTDYMSLLHDSVEIEYVHTGYESNTDRGWIVNLDFIITEGQPSIEPLKVDKFIEGSYRYGYTADNIENHLPSIPVQAHADASLLRYRVNLTGHGFENSEGCAEFCNKRCTYKWDSNIARQWQVWRLCGQNSLYPQGGTWVYDRANWCPGSVVDPNTIDFKVAGGSSHQFDIDMEPFTAPDQTQYSNFYFSGHIIHYRSPANANDAMMDVIISPNKNIYFNRSNPICSNPIIKIKNAGSDSLTDLMITYGMQGAQHFNYYWHGHLAFNESAELQLPYTFLNATSSSSVFEAWTSWPNSQPDANTVNDTLRTEAVIPPTYDSVFVITLTTNNFGNETAYDLKDASGTVLYSRALNTLSNNTVYRDTVHLTTGCYEFNLYDSGNDGLKWWANPDQGTGYCRFVKMGGGNILNFNTDFGAKISQRFMVGDVELSPPNGVEKEDEFHFTVFPNPTKGLLNVDLSTTINQDVNIMVYDPLGKMIEQRSYKDVHQQLCSFDLSAYASGIYTVRIKGNDTNQVVRVLLSK